MLLKSADDKTKRVRLLEELQRSDRLDSVQRDWLENELDRLRKGIAGEKSAAYYLNSYLADSQNSVLMHDLRFDVGGEVAQIDHMLITRGAGILLFETKNFSGNLCINEYGEFSVAYGARTFGIASPLEQSRRHAMVLQKLLDELDITARLGKRMVFHHLVLVDPKATISRPPAKAFDTSMVIKADAFPEWHKRFVDSDMGVMDVVMGLANLRSAETVKNWGEKLLRQHRPANLVRLPDFLAPKIASPLPSESPPTPRGPTFGGLTQAKPDGSAPPKKLICAQCGTKISYAEGKFCWNNLKRFGGLQYCREHQAQRT